MELFELVIGLLIAGALLAAGSRRLGVPYPVLLALAGAVAAYLPGAHAVALDPGLALALFVAPVLMDAAFDASPRDIWESALTISLLAVVVVGLTVAAVALVARALVPGMPWAAAVALGAVVAPSDASAAIAVLRALRPPHRLMVILEGESLFNDASALIIYRLAVGFAVGDLAVGPGLAPTLLVALFGGVALGWGLARLLSLAPLHRADMPIDVLLQFLLTFAVWIVAERVGASPIITVVVYAVTIARTAPGRMDARRRIASYAVWEVAVFVLNMLAFTFIGLQIKAIQERLDGRLLDYAGVAAAVLAATILVRAAAAMGWNLVIRRGIVTVVSGETARAVRPTVGGGVVIAWCGMRGIVTLATALALPDHFPNRDLVVFCAFWVALGSLALQGLTLKPLMRRLTLPEDDTVEQEVAMARRRTAEAAEAALARFEEREPEAVGLLRREYRARAEAEAASGEDPMAELQGHAVAAQRRTLLALRRHGHIGDDAFHVVEEEIDVVELTADSRIRTIGPGAAAADAAGEGTR